MEQNAVAVRVNAEWLKLLRERAAKRVADALTGVYNGLGPLDREELGAMMDGAQEAVAEWLPPQKGSK